LDAYKDVLEFEAEHPLTSEPLRIDVLIIKKHRDAVIEKNIASIFKGHNILEYKGPGDHMSVSDFHKTYAYVHQYVSIRNIDVTDLSLSIVGTGYPRALARYLKKTYRFSIKKQHDGIHIVTGEIFPIQIIESKKLSATDNLWLRGLGNQLNAEELEKIERERAKQGKGANLNAYMKAILQANMEVVKEVVKMGYSSLQEVVEELIEEGYFKNLANKLEVRGEARKNAEVAEAAKNMLLDGQSPENISKWLKLPMDTVRQIQESLNH
jgi:hypothetical protein